MTQINPANRASETQVAPYSCEASESTSWWDSISGFIFDRGDAAEQKEDKGDLSDRVITPQAPKPKETPKKSAPQPTPQVEEKAPVEKPKAEEKPAPKPAPKPIEVKPAPKPVEVKPAPKPIEVKPEQLRPKPEKPKKTEATQPPARPKNTMPIDASMRKVVRESSKTIEAYRTEALARLELITAAFAPTREEINKLERRMKQLRNQSNTPPNKNGKSHERILKNMDTVAVKLDALRAERLGFERRKRYEQQTLSLTARAEKDLEKLERAILGSEVDKAQWKECIANVKQIETELKSRFHKD